jgi:hypothetical protein
MRKGSSGFPVTRSRWVAGLANTLPARISEAMAPFRDQLKLVDGIPGVGPPPPRSSSPKPAVT